MMRSLKHKYNRVYYRNVALIRLRYRCRLVFIHSHKHTKLLRSLFAAKCIKLAVKADPAFVVGYNNSIIRDYEKRMGYIDY